MFGTVPTKRPKISANQNDKEKVQNEAHLLLALKSILTPTTANIELSQLTGTKKAMLATYGFTTDIEAKLHQLNSVLRNSLILTRGLADWVSDMLTIRGLWGHFLCVVDTHGGVIFRDGTRYSLPKGMLTEFGVDDHELEKDLFCAELRNLLDSSCAEHDVLYSVHYVDDQLETEWLEQNPDSAQRIHFHRILPEGPGISDKDIEEIMWAVKKDTSTHSVGVFDFDHTLTKMHFYKIMAGLHQFPFSENAV